MAASLEYFDKVKLKGNNPERLQERYQEATKGLDKDVAFEALEGGRVFDTGDRERYDALMAKRGQAKETAQAVKAEPPKKTEESVEKAQNFANENVQQVEENIPMMNTGTGQNRTFGDNQNTIGDNNEIFGNVNQGNQDFSVNIAGGSKGYMSNLGYGAAAKASMENSYNRDRATFSAGGEAAKYAKQANSVTGASNRIKALDSATDKNIDYFRKASDRATMGLYGDIWNMKAPSWKAPGDLDPIEVTYNQN